MATMKDKIKVKEFLPITGFPIHPYQPKYPDDPSYCLYENEDGEGCPGVEAHPIHRTGQQTLDPENTPLQPLIAWIHYMANEAGHEFTIQQTFRPGEEPNSHWVILGDGGFHVATVAIMEDGSLQFKYDWMSNARSVDGYDVVPFLIATIHWLSEGR